jgi:hypothetical protein
VLKFDEQECKVHDKDMITDAAFLEQTSSRNVQYRQLKEEADRENSLNIKRQRKNPIASMFDLNNPPVA